MSSLHATFQDAMARRRADDLEEAARLYRAVLEIDLEYPGANHLLGGVLHPCGDKEAVLSSRREAVVLRPTENRSWLVLTAPALQGAESRTARWA